MAPRNSKKDNTNNKNGPPASHPQENYVEHRAFLIRSLQRNDVDLAALTDLNRTLQKSKQAILQSCGELILLDLGQGRLTLVNDELHMKSDSADEKISVERHDLDFPLTPIQKQLCVDFLWRMKLRRKLSNRLARRLGRLAHAMDGEDVAPPAPPKYGDLRLHIDPAAVQQYADHWQRQEAAKKRILSMDPPDPFGSLLPMPVPKTEETSQVVTDTEEATDTASKEEFTTKEENKEEETKEENKEEEATPMEIEPADETKIDVDVEEAPEAPAPADAVPLEEPAAASAPGDDDQAPPATPAVDEDEAPDAIESTDAATATAVKPTPTASSILLPPPPMDEVALAEYQRDIDVLREFHSIYEKVWHPTTNTYEYTLAEEDPQEDPSGNKYPAGIGATHRSMSARERETEHKRWHTALLARIPEQPTFEELGLANRVFFLGERRKRCLERENEQDDENEEPKSKKLKTDDDREKGEKIESKDEKLKQDSEEEEADVDEKEPKEEEKSDDQKESKEGDDDDSDLLEGDEDKTAEKRKGKKGNDDDSSSDMFDDKSDDVEKADKKEKASKKKAKDGSDSDSSDMFDDNSDDEDEKKESKKGKTDSDDADDDDSGEKKEEERERKTVGGKTPLVPKLKTKSEEEEEKKEEEEEKQEEPIKRIRPMSLAPVPSFHEQDMKRICMIHADLMGASMHEHARKRLQDVTKEYNNSKGSFDLVSLRNKCQLAHTYFAVLFFKHSAFRMSSLNAD